MLLLRFQFLHKVVPFLRSCTNYFQDLKVSFAYHSGSYVRGQERTLYFVCFPTYLKQWNFCYNRSNCSCHYPVHWWLFFHSSDYPEPPTNIEISQTENQRAVLVQWTPAPPLSVEGGSAITGYAVYVNNQRCLQLAANETPTERVCAQLLHGDLKHLKFVQQQQGVSLTVRALAGGYESADSSSVVISKEMLTLVFEGGKDGSMFPEEGESESSHISVSSGEDERELYSPARKALEGSGHVTADVIQDVEHVTEHEEHVTQQENHVPLNADHVPLDADHVPLDADHVTLHEDHVVQNESHVTQDENYLLQDEDHVIQDADHVGQDEGHVTQHATQDDHVVNGANFLEMIADESDGESRTGM